MVHWHRNRHRHVNGNGNRIHSSNGIRHRDTNGHSNKIKTEGIMIPLWEGLLSTRFPILEVSEFVHMISSFVCFFAIPWLSVLNSAIRSLEVSLVLTRFADSGAQSWSSLFSSGPPCACTFTSPHSPHWFPQCLYLQRAACLALHAVTLDYILVFLSNLAFVEPAFIYMHMYMYIGIRIRPCFHLYLPTTFWLACSKFCL